MGPLGVFKMWSRSIRIHEQNPVTIGSDNDLVINPDGHVRVLLIVKFEKQREKFSEMLLNSIYSACQLTIQF